MKKIILLFIIILFSCKDYGNPLSVDDDDSDGGDNSSYTYSDIQNIFNEYCTGCHHNGQNPSGGLNLTSYDDVMNSGSVDSENTAESSQLYNRIILQESDGLSMPQDSPKLSDANIALIERWINDGATSE